MKVLIVTDYFYPHWTGISKSIFNLTQALNKEFDFTVLTVRYDLKLKQNETINSVKIIRENYLFSLSRAKYSPFTVIKFINIIKNYDVVFINSPCSNILPISIISKLFNKKLIIFHQGDLILPKSFSNKILEKIFDISTKISFSLANKISTYTADYAQYSRVMKQFLYKFFPMILPVSINSTSLSKPNKRLNNLIKLRKQEKIIFGFAGRFVEEKGFDILLDAIPSVIKKNKKVHFVFAGETNIGYENFFEKNQNRIKKINKYLTSLGLLDNKEMSVFYKNIDFIVVPSRSDCFNLVQAESMLNKKPSIVSDIPGARYLVKKTGFGLLFKKNDPEDLSEKIIEIIRRKSLIILNYKKVKEILNPKLNEHLLKKAFSQ